jgi:nitrate/TMAO reductase-like tetraheme cytochrome c subunit
MNESKKQRTRWWIGVPVLMVLPLLIMASWVGTEYLLGQTSEVEFCMSCHTMVPISKAFLKSKHGGNNRLGIRAKCTDCHLPHDNTVNYLFTKARLGLRDTWAQWFQDIESINWQAKRAERHRFVYDSGCLKCHRGLEHSTQPTHPAYFAGGSNPFAGQKLFRCVTCHFSVGHQDLSHWLTAYAKDPYHGSQIR